MRTTGPLNINGEGGMESVWVGDANAGGLQGIYGSVHVANYGGLTNLFVDDSADKSDRTVALDSANGVGTIAGLGQSSSSTISYNNSQIGYLTVDTGGGLKGSTSSA
jgi:hypothetical protein